jgi:erythromycin esterase-like protein
MKTGTSWQKRNALRYILFSVVFCVLGIVPNTPSSADDRQFVAWAEQNAVHFNSLDCHKVNLGDLSFLDTALEGKRIVYLGESDHWVNQKYDYRLILMHYLFTKGWRRIGMEMDFCDGKRIDRYLEAGDPSHLERVALYGYRGGWRKDRDDIPKGFPGMENLEFRKAFLNREYAFLKQLRSLNEAAPSGSPRLRWFGFDVGLIPCVGYEDANAILARHADAPVIQEVQKRIARVDGETRAEEAQRLDDLLGFIEKESSSITSILGENPAKDLVRTLRHEVDYLLFADAAKEGPRTNEWIYGLIRREQRMVWLMDKILADLPADEKIILMGHNLHLSKDSEGIKFGPTGSPAPGMWVSIGTYLEKRFPGEVYSMWMMYDHGRHGSILLPEGVAEVPSNPLCVEHLLSEVGESFFLPLNSGEEGESFLHEPHNFLQNGSVASAVIAEQADALFFVREVTELLEK